jgi:hypothetical protein
MKFKSYFNLMEFTLSTPLGITIPPPAFGALTPDWTGTDTNSMPLRAGGFVGTNHHHQQLDIGLPTTSKTSKICILKDKQNPILMALEDGTRLYLPYDSFKRITGEPELGRMVTIVMQRRIDDNSATPSQIQSIHCH